MIKHCSIYLFLSFCIVSNIYSQSNHLDSLKNIKSACPAPCPGDTVKLRLLAQSTEVCEMEDILNYAAATIKLADEILNNSKNLSVEQKNLVLKHKVLAIYNSAFFYQQTGDNPRALNAYGKGLRIYGELNDKSGMSNSFSNIGFIYNFNGDFYKALDYYNRSLKLREEIGDKQGIATSLHIIARTYDKRGNAEKGLEYYYKSLKIFEELGKKYEISSLLNEMAGIYADQGDNDKAFENYEKSLKLREEIGDKGGIANSLHNIGMMYSEFTKRDLDKALDYFNRSLKISEEIGLKNGLATLHTSIGNIYEKNGEIQKAHGYYNKSLEMFREMNDPEGIASALCHVGLTFSLQKNFKSAVSYASEGNMIARKLGFVEIIRNSEETLYFIYRDKGDYAGAFEHYKQFIIFNDSISNQQTRKASIKHQLKYEFEKKEAVIIEQQEKERAVAGEKNRRQQIIIGAAVLGFILVMVFASFVFRSLKTTRRQKMIIEEKQKEILDSIYYARRIQRSLLPNESYIAKNLNRRPKN